MVTMALVLAGILPASTYALSKSRLDFFAENNILFYDPDAGSSGFSCTGDNRNYAGATVWSSAELGAIDANRSVYEEAAAKYNFPWQVLAVLHSIETSLRKYNPTNGQGVYQLYSYTGGGLNNNRFMPSDSITDEEFRRQTNIAAEVVSGMVGDLNNENNVKRLFFQYNGASDKYIQKAIQMGFSEEEAKNGEGSAYVMNRFDARRDPTSGEMSAYWPGRYVKDGVYNESSTSEVFGAFVKYKALYGGEVCSYAGGSIAETALALSWDGHRSHGKDDPKPEYVEAMKSVGAYTRGNGVAPYGASCDQFVGTVMRYSKADMAFPVFGPGVQKAYMESHPEMYSRIDANGDFSVLQPGDIFVTASGTGRHIYLYVGIINGQMYQASASFDDRTAEHFSGVYFSDTVSAGRRFYDVYRRLDYD